VALETAYLTVTDFKTGSNMPDEDVDFLETAYPGYLDKRLLRVSATINALLKRLYAVPFEAPVPEIVLGWVTDIVTYDAYMKRGYNPGSQQDGQIKLDRDLAIAQIKEAGDSDEGLFDLPLRATAPEASGRTKSGPFGYSEQSPYVAFDVQVDAARNEDRARRGT
jgi:hypothetical protein